MLAGSHLPDDHQPRMDADANGQANAAFSLQAGIDPGHRLQHLETGTNGASRVVFMRVRPSEIDQERVPEKLPDMTVEPLDDLGARALVCPHDLSEVLGVQLSGQCCGANQVTEHHRELTAFGTGRRRFGWRPSVARSDIRDRCLCRGVARRAQRWISAFELTHPDEHRAVLVDRDPSDVDEFILEVREVGVVDGELPLQSSIRDTLVLAEPVDSFGHHLPERHVAPPPHQTVRDRREVGGRGHGPDPPRTVSMSRRWVPLAAEPGRMTRMLSIEAFLTAVRIRSVAPYLVGRRRLHNAIALR
jgi:hypothetical protein